MQLLRLCHRLSVLRPRQILDGGQLVSHRLRFLMRVGHGRHRMPPHGLLVSPSVPDSGDDAPRRNRLGGSGAEITSARGAHI